MLYSNKATSKVSWQDNNELATGPQSISLRKKYKESVELGKKKRIGRKRIFEEAVGSDESEAAEMKIPASSSVKRGQPSVRKEITVESFNR